MGKGRRRGKRRRGRRIVRLVTPGRETCQNIVHTSVCVWGGGRASTHTHTHTIVVKMQ